MERAWLVVAAAGCGRIGFDGAPTVAFDEAGYAHRALVIVTNTAQVNLGLGHQISATLPAEILATARPDASDVRCVRDEVELPMIIDAAPAPTLWIALAAPLAVDAMVDHCWLYWGHPSPPPPAFGAADVMDFVDEFSGSTLDTSRWATMGTPMLGGDELELPPGEVGVRSLVTWPPYTAIDFTMSVNGTPSLEYWAGFQRTNDFDYSFPWVLWISRNGVDVRPELKFYNNINTIAGTASAADATLTHFTIARFEERAHYFRAHASVGELAFANMPLLDPLQVRLHNRSTATTLRFGMIRVRRTTLLPPTISFGLIEDL